MTNKEYREANKLTSSEKAQMWHEISEPFNTRQRRTPSWVPWAGGLTAAACALAVAIMTGHLDGRGTAPDPMDVAVLPSGVPEAAPPATANDVVMIEEEFEVDGEMMLDEAVAEPTARVVVEEPAPQAAAKVLGAESREFIEPAEVAQTRDVQARRAELTATASGVIRGQVRDGDTGDPLTSAVVSVVGTRRMTYTDNDGWFTFRDLESGQHTVEVGYLGYASASQMFTVVSADTVQASYALRVVLAETLQAFDVEAAKYMVEVRSTKTDQVVGAEQAERFARDSVEEALSHEAGILMRAGKLAVRGGRSGEVQTQNDGVSVQPLGDRPTPAPESGGSHNPNDRPYDLVYHQHYGVNPFVATEDDALSTFAIEVDDASWSVSRRYLEDGHLPPPEAVRLEEMVNYLDAGLRHTRGEDFSLHIDGMPSAFGDGLHLVRVGVTARSIDADQRRPAHLVFVIDVSGSMNRENRLGLVKRSLRVLTDQLQEGDRVGIVIYGSEARTVLEPTGIENRGIILNAIDGVRSGGSTNAEAGLRMAYRMARREQRPGTISRLILCSDGVANVGRTGADSILDAVRDQADEGITLTTVGFGMGNYNDVAMEQLANQGDGTYHYVHQMQDAERIFRENLTGTLEAMGREVKTQVEFDPKFVQRWRLLGYENRDVADEDFRNDAVDAGDIGAGHTAVALYELKLTDRALDDLRRGWSLPLGTVRLRWARPAHHEQAGQVTEIQRGLMTADLSESYDTAPALLRLATVAAEFAEILRQSFWAKGNDLVDLVALAQDLAIELRTDDAIELHLMITRAASLEINED